MEYFLISETKGQSICKIVKSLVSNFAFVLYFFQIENNKFNPPKLPKTYIHVVNFSCNSKTGFTLKLQEAYAGN